MKERFIRGYYNKYLMLEGKKIAISSMKKKRWMIWLQDPGRGILDSYYLLKMLLFLKREKNRISALEHKEQVLNRYQCILNEVLPWAL